GALVVQQPTGGNDEVDDADLATSHDPAQEGGLRRSRRTPRRIPRAISCLLEAPGRRRRIRRMAGGSLNPDHGTLRLSILPGSPAPARLGRMGNFADDVIV